MDERTGNRGRTALRVAAVVGIVFGALTIVSGGRVLFAGADAGAAVPFVLWFNFLAGFVYVGAGIALWRRWPGAVWLAGGLFAATAAVSVALGIHILGGGAYETRTVGAMGLRALVWLAITAVAVRGLRPRPASRNPGVPG